MATFDGKFMTFYLMAIVKFALSLTIYEKFAIEIKCKKFVLENGGKSQGGEKLDLRRSTGNVRYYIDEFFFRIGNYPVTYV